MIKSVFRLLSFIWIVTGSSCGNTNDMEQVISTYQDGSIKVKRIYFEKGDTARYIQMVYFSDGRVKDSVAVINGRYEGVRKWVDKEDNKVYVLNYFQGLQHGPDETYYESGKLYSRGTYFEGTAVGPTYFYHEDGSLKQYDYRTNFGGITYRRLYDEDGKYVGFRGTAVIQYRTSSDSAISGEIFSGEIDLVIPDNCISRIYDYNSQNAQTTLNLKTGSETETTKTTIFTYHSPVAGTDTLNFYWEVFDTIQNVHDTGIAVIPVKIVDKE